MCMQVTAGHWACVATAPTCSVQAVVNPVPTSCSQNGLLAPAASAVWRIKALAPPPITNPSQTSSCRAVMMGGDPKCMAMGSLVWARICLFPATSPCGMGVSTMATLGCFSSSRR